MWLETVAFLGAGLVVGAISSLFGVGGGSVLIPLLTLGFGYGIHQAIAASLVIIVPTALLGAYKHSGENKIPWRVAVFTALGGLGGANIGVDMSLALPEHVLRRLFVGLLLFVSVQMYVSTYKGRWKRSSKKSRTKYTKDESAAAHDEEVAGFPSDDRQHEYGAVDNAQRSKPKPTEGISRRYGVGHLALFVLTGILTGIISSLFGIGGGILLVPVMTLAFKMRVHQAVAVSLAVIVPTSVMGAYRHAVVGNVPWLATVMIATGGLLGAHFGVSWSHMLSETRLRRFFALLLVVVAIRMFF